MTLDIGNTLLWCNNLWVEILRICLIKQSSIVVLTIYFEQYCFYYPIHVHGNVCVYIYVSKYKAILPNFIILKMLVIIV